MAIATNDSLIVNKEGAPIDARTVAPTLAALAEIENPYVGLRVFVTETGKEYRVTENWKRKQMEKLGGGQE